MTRRPWPGAVPTHTAARGVAPGAWRFPLGAAFLLALALALSLVRPVEAQSVRRMIVTTNYVVVTNVVVVTNYVDTPGPVVPFAAPAPLAPVWPEPGPGDPSFDWVQLKSGEWLKGRIRALQDESLDFDSEELEDQTFDWEDIRELRSARPMVVEFKDRRMVRGPVAITGSVVRVAGETPVSLPRTNLFALTPGGGREFDLWTAKVSAGLNVRTGNAEQTDYNARVDLSRRTPGTRFDLDYVGAFSRIDGMKSEDNHRVNTQFDYWLSPRFFVRVPFLEYLRDPFQNLRHRLTAGAGVGYDLFDAPKFEWNITTGPAFQKAWFDSVLPGEADSQSAAALVFGTRLDYELSRRVDLAAEYRGQYTRREIGETTHHAELRFEIELTEHLDLDLSVVWDRIAHPKAASDGTVPEPDDFRFITTLGIEF